LTDDPEPQSPQKDPEAERAKAIALLAATHQFPVAYDVSIIAMNVDTVVEDVRAAVEHGLPEPLGDEAYQTVPSKGGRYSSHRFKVPCQTPEDVLALYARIKRVKGVITVL
jgi:putative lipoic acid-binding regulatory protein